MDGVMVAAVVVVVVAGGKGGGVSFIRRSVPFKW